MKDEKEQAELEAILEEASKHKPASKGKASAKVELHYVAQCLVNFVGTHDKDTVAPAKSALVDHDLSDDNLQAILATELAPETNHIVRWLLKIPFAERTEWQA